MILTLSSELEFLSGTYCEEYFFIRSIQFLQNIVKLVNA
jgi:hypothetical protein